MATVTVKEQAVVGEGLYALTFASPVRLSRPGAYEPGQFLHIRVTDSFDYLLRRPLSLCKVDVERNEMTVVYRAQGDGTKRLSRLGVGDLLDVLGPLGHGFPLHGEDRRALLIAGGIGVPPMVELARALTAAGQVVHSIVGFQSAGQAILLDDLRRCGDVSVVSNDGSIGVQGLVTDLLSETLCKDASRFYACGPTPMLRAVQSVMRARAVPGYLSLEERMGCGIGICVGCVHPIVRGETVKHVKTCKEGPVFASEEVVFA